MDVCTQPFVTLSDSNGEMSGVVADDTSESGAESVQLIYTRLAHYRETLCAVKPLQTSSSNTALVLTRQQHIELLNVSVLCHLMKQSNEQGCNFKVGHGSLLFDPTQSDPNH